MTRVWPPHPHAVVTGVSSDALLDHLERVLVDSRHHPLSVQPPEAVVSMIGGQDHPLLVVLGDQLPLHQAEILIHEVLQAPQPCAVVALMVEADQAGIAALLVAGVDEILLLPSTGTALRRGVDFAWLRCRRRRSAPRPPAAEAALRSLTGGEESGEVSRQTRRLQGDLLRSEAALRAALEATDLGLAEVDLHDLHIITANDRLWRMLDGPGGQPLQLPLPDLAITADRERIAAACAEAECFGRRVELADIRCDLPGHRTAVLDLSILPVVVDGPPAALAMVAFREVEVDRGPDSAQPLDAALEFAAAATHDLMAPLQTLSGFLDLLAKRSKDRLDDHDHEMIVRALRATTSMRGTIIDMLAWARTGSLSGNSVPFQVAEAVEQSLSHLDLAGATVEVAVQDLPPIQASAGIVSRVIQNLVLNAVRFVPGPGGKVRISATTDAARKQVVVAVTDNGPGVVPEERDRVFQLFHTDGGGLGIGLAFCRRAIRACGGEIWIEDDPGGGARFCFSLRLAAEAADPPPGLGRQPSWHQSLTKVDDEGSWSPR